MYKCKECGTEFEIKPDFCDCGNDEFEVIEIKKTEEKSQKEPEPKIGTNAQNKPRPASSLNRQNDDKQVIPPLLPKPNPISLTIFCICILLSLYVIFFAWNPKESEVIGDNKPETPTVKNIPSIDKFWNNTPPVAKLIPVKQEEIKPVETITNAVKQIMPVAKPIQTAVVKPVQQVQKPASTPKTTTVKLTKSTPAAKPQTTSAKTQTTSLKTNSQDTAKKQAEEAAKKKAQEQAQKQAQLDAERKAAEEAQIKKLQAEQAKKAEAEKAAKAAASKQELYSYKTGLRNTIGRKIDFSKVIGDGSCTVSFRIDSNGKLINRAFSQQSTNMTLNDAVYNAVMQTPAYNPPPSSYKSEKLNLYIKFYNGNFEISLQ